MQMYNYYISLITKENKLIDFSRLEICVRTEEDTYDKYLNDFVTIYI
ncbi:hypothetical protein ALC53_10422 [Atta colombica]|uniref:Uncharacterized protein n=1 Tax=Atta colombica TaxID=520822 RepID=A0A195B445_9HYME|nr:hypothetical protein ALC53_10422 [Atta colombica]